MIAPNLKRKILVFLVLCLIAFGAILLLRYFASNRNGHEQAEQKRLESTIRKKEQQLSQTLEKVLSNDSLQIPFLALHREIKPELWQKEGFAVFLYKKDSLVYWSDNNVPSQETLNKELFSRNFMHYGNGWFRIIKEKKGNFIAIGLILVKNDYPYQNEYLVNDFQEDLCPGKNATIDTIPGKINIRSGNGDFLFSVDERQYSHLGNGTGLAIFVLWVALFIFLVVLLYYLYHLFDFFNNYKHWLLMAFFFDAILFRLIFLYFEIPRFIYDLDIFSPFYYATSLISPSLGDFVLNSLLWLTLAWIFYSEFAVSLDNLKKPLKSVLFALIGLIPGILFYLLLLTTKRLVLDSNIETNLNNIFNLDLYSVLGFLSLAVLSLAFFLVTSRLCLILLKKLPAWSRAILFLEAGLMAFILFHVKLSYWESLTYATLLVLYLLIVGYFAKRRQSFMDLTGALVLIILFSMIITIVLDINHSKKEKENRKIIAAELSSQRDPLMEYEFGKLKDQIVDDSIVDRLLSAWKIEKEDENRIIQYIHDHYLVSFWNNYDILLTICRREDELNIQPENYLTNCYDYFIGRLNSPGSDDVGNGLFFQSDKMGNGSYLAGVDVLLPSSNGTDSLKLFIEIYHKYFYETGLGYPDLLIDQNVKKISGLDDYSYAKYTGGKLIYKNGDFAYRLDFKTYEQPNQEAYFIENDGYNHYILRQNASNTLIISKKEPTFLDYIAPFSYLFILFSLFILVFLAGLIIFSKKKEAIEFNFSNQLQVSIITIIIISFFILGIITRANIIHLYSDKNQDNLSEKTFSILTELEHKLGNEKEITADLEPYIAELLYNFSSIFYSDINLFDTRGSLIASSRPQIFDEELLSRKMDPGAYYKLTIGQKLIYIQNEKIGQQEYLSAYVPFRNNKDQIIAYLNLPYFAKQTELKKEIADFLAAYINVYVLLIVLAIMITIIVSRLISRPLKLIGERLGGIGFGKSNEKIAWKRKDEVGKLVEEYNRMIDELARSADILARSERESAWREMAKQVAHEIKNPLTPMKLSVQYLQKTWNEKSPDWEIHLERFTRTIVEQIDSLSEIASEFSDFAKMPAALIEKTGLVQTARDASELFSHHENIKITLTPTDSEFYVMADKKQLLRVFNNLITNSIQAIGKKSDGLIRITISEENENYVVRITDNGSGISEEQAGKIFSPSFTTKSSGMGLGLAMVKSILTSINATINFESISGEGTTFMLKIPVLKP
jgi:two-component system, NtrC family, nitrogen regulation sensor histidine kinase NtrY